MKHKYLWKSLREGMKSGYSDYGWKIGKWRKHDGELEMCQSGFHASEYVQDAMNYVRCEILAKVEVRGKHLKQSDKQCWSEMRIVKAWEWKREDSVAMAVFAARLVLPIFEKKYPDDDRPRRAIEAAEKWLKEPTKENVLAALVSADVAHAADVAARAAYAAARAAHAADAADAAAYAAAHAADAAAYAAADVADAAAYAADAAYATAHAADVAARAAPTKSNIHRWIITHTKNLKEIK